MDISRLKKKDLQAWLPLTEEVEILCQYVNRSEMDRILAEATITRMNPGTGLRSEERDEPKFRSLLGRAVVKDWRGLRDGETEFPCTPENVVYLMEDYAEFRVLVLSVPMSFERMLAAEKAQAEKNSATTSAPNAITQE